MSERTDTERLDWLEHTLSDLHCNWTTPDDWTVTLHGADAGIIGECHGLTIRAAIDAAIAVMSRTAMDAER